MAGFVLVASAAATPPAPPQIIPDSAFHSVTVPVIQDFKVLEALADRRPEVVAVQPTPVTVVRHSVPTVADAKAYALAQLGPTQYHCLDQIIIKESNWNPLDVNRTSGAYGLGQALPGSKMAWAGADWRWNPITQVRWVIHYVDGRYGSACNAWSFWLGHRWY